MTTFIAFLATPPPRRAGASVLRALRDDVPRRYVELAATAGASGSHPYELAGQDGDPDGAGGVLLVDPFDAPERRRLRELYALQRGYLGTRLFHGEADAAGFAFVGITRWSSPLMYARLLREHAGDDNAGSAALYLPAVP